MSMAEVVDDKNSLRVVGGTNSSAFQFPYQVAIFLHKHLDRGYSFCGGSVISPNYVLTAAQCFRKHTISTINLLFGARNVSNWEPGHYWITLRGSAAIVHEDYDLETRNNDIALIKLDEELQFDEAIQPVRLPENDNDDYVGKTGTIAGWGHYKEDEFGISPWMNFVNVTVMSNEECKTYDYDFDQLVTSNNLCSSGEGVLSLCEGDYGGPLVIDGVQVGIMSWYWDEQGTCFLSMPSVYANVAAYRSWIKEHSGI
ncbi:trypsin delta-like [Cylas formicarius]|uniref:trypsin delta-like n=1 Tax=Cylas formicarius TaxID=197179 RepID=UPI0029586AD2|nr:trypsin delta-like [Cylas formicarius]